MNIKQNIKKIVNFFKKRKFSNYNQRVSSKALLNKIALGKNISIGDDCYLYNITIDDYTYLAKNVTIMNSSIGKFCSIAQGVVISAGIHPSKKFVSTSPVFYSPHKQCGISFSEISYFREMGNSVIGNDVWIGANSIIKDDITIGDGAIIGAGSIVTKNVEPYTIVAGNPAKFIRYRFEREEIDFLLKFKWWNRNEEWIKNNFKDFHDIIYFKNKYDKN